MENTIKIKEPRTLDVSCRWLDGMVCTAKEDWQTKRNDPNELKERAITFLTEISGTSAPSNYGVIFCSMIYPSTFYDKNAHMIGKESLRPLPEYQAVLDRIKALIERKSS